jgi:molybdate transport system substrate-binding protein
MTSTIRRVALAAGVVAVAVLCATSASAVTGNSVAAAAAAPAAAGPPIELAMYAAASLKDALGAIAPVCEGRTGTKMVFNFGASNDLARQIVAADKADVFLSADEGWMDKVAEAGLLDAASRRSLLSNRLVVVVRSDSTLSIASGADLGSDAVKRLALANPDAVPAGRYAKAWLEQAGTWDKVRERVVPATDVRAALAAVEAGAVDAGIVYRTDAAIAKKVKVAWTVPESEGPKISYPIAAMKNSPRHDLARRVVDCYEGKEAHDLFERFGFVVLDPAAREPEPGGSRPEATSTRTR